jgi:MazG family protein
MPCNPKCHKVEERDASIIEVKMSITSTNQAFNRLLKIMAALRSPNGCPWDAEQTPESLKPYLLEETYEVLEAIDCGEPTAIRDELGDLLLQVVFQARIFEERGVFDMGDVAGAIADKLTRRHPHVFGDEKISDMKTLDAQWDQIKAREKAQSTVLGGIPRDLPALLRARKLSEKANRIGFDLPETKGIFNKIHGELGEFEQAMQRNDRRAMEKKLGDLLFAMVNLGRLGNLDAEEALREKANLFVERFEYIEKILAEEGRNFQQISLEELDALWEETKGLEKEKESGAPKT